jgi:hypothetical protein
MNLRRISSLFARFFGVLTLCCCALSACDRNPEPAQTPATTPRQVVKSSANSSAADPLAGMVKAVTSDTRQHVIELRFELAGRPEVGAAVDVKLNLQAVDDAAEVKLMLATDPKISIIAGGEAAFATIKAGESVSHIVTLRGTEAGIFVLDAKLTTTANGGPRTLNYAIPVAIVPVVSEASGSAPAPAAQRK